MGYDTALADRVREYLSLHSQQPVTEKEMFRGLCFLVDGKMCVNISGDSLMCRFDPQLQPELEGRRGYESMLMKGKELKGYCYVRPEGFKTQKEFAGWIGLCLDFNARAKSSRKAKK
jgi:TfoX/Sxy family transcriptional regulator of competence genes